MSQGLEANQGDVLLLVGTRKGAFLLASDTSRTEWSISGPNHAGSDVFHMAYDERDGGTVFVAINSPIWGPEIQRSRDLGASWQPATRNPSFVGGCKEPVEKVWHLAPGRSSEPGVVYAGVSPAALFKSVDGGDAWAEVESLTAQPTHDRWEPGFGGLCLHSMVLDPTNNDRLWVAISAVGVFGTDDGGATWSR